MAFYKQVTVFEPEGGVGFSTWIENGFGTSDNSVDEIQIKDNSVIVIIDRTNPDSWREYVDCPATISQIEIV